MEVVLGITIGAVAVPLIGCGLAASVPFVMSATGTVVAGVGTMHAPLSAFGLSAICQSLAAKLVCVTTSASGAAVGGAIGYFRDK